MAPQPIQIQIGKTTIWAEGVQRIMLRNDGTWDDQVSLKTVTVCNPNYFQGWLRLRAHSWQKP